VHKIGDFMLVFAWFIVACFAIYAVMPSLETRFFPPYSTFQLVTATETADGTIATFEFIKNRDCAPKGLSWYIGEDGQSTSVDTSTPSGTRSPRPLGLQTTSPYLFPNVSVDVLKSDMIAVLRNQCNFPWTAIPLPWVSVSWVYP